MSTVDTPLPVGPPPEASQPKLSEVERITNTFIAPSKTFIDIKRSAMWITPWLLMVVVSIVFAVVVDKKIGFENVAENNRRFVPAFVLEQMEKQGPEAKAKFERDFIQQVKRTAYSAFVIRTIFWAIGALVFWLIFSFGMAAEVRYKEVLAIIAYSTLPLTIRFVLATISAAINSDPSVFLIDNPVGTNPGYFLSFAETPKFVYMMASSIDIFTIWMLVLIAIGLAVVGKVKRGTAMVVILGTYFLVMGLFSGLIAMMG